MKHVVICADDYGQNQAVSQGIIKLILKNRLTATSCITNSLYWSAHAAWLKPVCDHVDIGLHFNLTEGQPLSEPYRARYGMVFPSLKKLIFQVLSRQLDARIIAEELRAQLDQFSMGMNGHAPDFIDGHQHVHHFPIIRQAVLQVYKERFIGKKAYIRCCAEKIDLARPAALKRWIIQVLGARALKQALDLAGIPYNSSFEGVYSFDRAQYYSAFFPEFLAKVADKGIIMCHPGLHVHDASDPIAAARFREYQYLISDQFLADCQAKRILLSRF